MFDSSVMLPPLALDSRSCISVQSFSLHRSHFGERVSIILVRSSARTVFSAARLGLTARMRERFTSG